ncbi:type II secretion system protein GspL, partial [Pseudomonas aeruginosa]
MGVLLGLLGEAATVIGVEPTVSVEQLDISAARGDVPLQGRAPGLGVLVRDACAFTEYGDAVHHGLGRRDCTNVNAP